MFTFGDLVYKTLKRVDNDSPLTQKRKSGRSKITLSPKILDHYANATQNLMRDLGITFVPKDQNPPAAPEDRPIERFWQHLKSRVYKGGWGAKNRSGTPIEDPEKAGYLR
jgi:hypothetical protein